MGGGLTGEGAAGDGRPQFDAESEPKPHATGPTKVASGADPDRILVAKIPPPGNFPPPRAGQPVRGGTIFGYLR